MARRFLADAMLGSLVTHLRMCGYDTAYTLEREIEDDEAILELARREDRQVLTRDARLASGRSEATLIESTELDAQLRELQAAGIELSLDSPTRCSHCNARLARLEGGRTPTHAPDPDAEPVWRCRGCGHHYWKGSHWDAVAERLDSL